MKTNNLKFILLILATFFITSCARVSDIVPQISLPILGSYNTSDGVDIEVANNLLAAGKRREAAKAYFSASKNYRSPQRERLILQAAELSAIFKDAKLTQHYLAPINYNRLNTENKARFRFAQAQLALNDRNYREALRILPQRVNNLPKALGSKILSARVKATQSSGDKLSLVQELILQEPLLKNSYEVDLNHDRIWNHLKQMSSQQINDGIKTSNHAVLKGWLELASINKANNIDSKLLREKVRRWEKLNPRHPGKNKTIQILSASPAATVTPYLGGIKPAPNNDGKKQIAVILPLTGNLSKIGSTILKGIKDAKKNSRNTTLKVYNSSTSSIEGLYKTAVDKGANFIIGPFHKAKITSLTQTQISVPTLALNYVPGYSKNFYQFGLSPEDEAQQVAQFSLAKGQRRVAILAPSSPWGLRVENAMKEAITNNGGNIVVIERYANNNANYDATADRLKKHADKLDAVLIAASPTQARLLYPALRKTIESLPIYATSHVFSGVANAERDAILDGLIYTEIPWVLDTLQQGTKSNTNFPRLHAMGMDALFIANNLPMLGSSGRSINGRTGKIKLSRGGNIHRSLRMAQFKSGIPAPY